MTIYNYYTIRELAPQQHECTPDMNFGYNAGRIKNRIYLPDTFIGATYYFDGEYSNRYGTSQIDNGGHPYIDINFNDGEIGNGTVFIIAGKRYCTFQYTLEYVNVHETEIDASEIDTSNLVTKQTFDNTVERIDNDITTGDTANRTAIDQLTAVTNQRFADVNTKLSGYDEQIGAVDTEVKNLASEVDGYSVDIAKAVADAADAKSVAESAADDAATADAAAKEAQDGVSALGTRVGAVENSVETAETTANEAKSAAQTAQTTAGEAQTAASGAKSRADEAYTLAETAQNDAEGATTKATTAQSTADGVKTRVDTIEETTIPGINSHVEALQAGEETLSKSIELLSGSVDTVEENYNTLSDSVGLLTAQADDNTQEITRLKARVSALESFLSGGAGVHNSIYRGKNLGSSVTTEQYAAIAAGAFDDLYIGDYWTINDVVYRIAAFDYYLHCGDAECTKHHVVLVPDTCLYNHVMNDTNTTTGAYVDSKMYTEGLSQAKTIIEAAFSGHVLSKRIYLSNVVSDGRASDGGWYDSEVDLMCEHMVYGNGVFSPVSDGTTVPNNYRVEKSQLPLFQHEPSRICNRAIWWLRDVISAVEFAGVTGGGNASCHGADVSGGVRPAFCIGVV